MRDHSAFAILQVMLDFSALDNVKTGLFNRFWIYLVGAVFSAYAGLFALTIHPLLTSAFFALAAILVIFIVYEFIRSQEALDKNRQAYIAFAHANQFEYEPESASVLNGTGTLFAHGHTKHTKHVLSGKTASGLPLQIFHYEYVTGSGKSRQSHYASVMRITLPRTLPHMVIDSLVEGTTANSVLPITFDQSQRVTVEGDFNNYFSLYAPDTYAVSMLSIIGPDVMWTLMQHAAACDIEIIDNYIYFYWPFVAQRRSEYESMFATADAVMKEVGKKLTKGNIYTSDSQAQLHSQAKSGGGVRLKAGTSVAGLAFIVIFLFIFVQPYINELFGTSFAAGPELSILFFIGIFGYAFYSNYRTQKRRQQLTRRFGPSAPKQ